MRKHTFLMTMILALLAIIISIEHFSLAAADTRQSPPAIPHLISGLVRVNGVFVSVGTRVSAWCGGEEVAEVLTFEEQGEANYVLYVDRDDPATTEKEGCSVGEEISFKIGHLDAEQTITWNAGGFDLLDLDASQDSSNIYLPLILK